MDWKDFTTHFNRVYCCLLGTCAADGQTLAAAWDPAAGTAGGKVDFGTFRQNPAFALRVELAPELAAKAKAVRVALTLSMPDARSAAAKADYPPVGLLAFDGGRRAGAAPRTATSPSCGGRAARARARRVLEQARRLGRGRAARRRPRARARRGRRAVDVAARRRVAVLALGRGLGRRRAAPPELATSAPPSLALAALERPLPRGARAEGAWSRRPARRAGASASSGRRAGRTRSGSCASATRAPRPPAPPRRPTCISSSRSAARGLLRRGRRAAQVPRRRRVHPRRLRRARNVRDSRAARARDARRDSRA